MKLLPKMAGAVLTAAAPLLAAPLAAPLAAQEPPDLGARAEAYLEAVYGCGADALETLAAPDVVSSYPVFVERFGTPAFRGRPALRSFAEGFCSRWSDAVLTVHEALLDRDRAVLVWSFEATGSGEGGVPAGRRGWGGITFFRFDAEGRVVEELGEESTPGPWARAHPGG